MVLIRPGLEYESSYRSYIRELGEEERYPFPLDFEHADFPALVRRLHNLSEGIGVAEGFVASTTFWLVDGGDIVGISNLRHHLNARIEHRGGHIGLGVRPSCRGQWLGNKLLALTIHEARVRGIGEIHIHCLKSNLASARMIVRNGGMLHSEVMDDGLEGAIQRYRV